MNDLTWTCHICGKERPDAQISVAQHDTSEAHGLPFGVMTKNIRYCNDTADCRKKAHLDNA